MTQIKICGLNSTPSIQTCIDARVEFIGFVFYPASPRAVTADAAASLAKPIPPTTKKVGLFVNPSLDQLRETIARVSLDAIQLHGDEQPEFINAVKSTTSLPVIKAVSIATPIDVKKISVFEPASDWILCDAKAQHSTIPGGNGISFDWSLLSGFKFTKPWMLSGGLNTENVQQALHALKPTAIDVSSGVEITRGVKDAQKIKDFVIKVRYG